MGEHLGSQSFFYPGLTRQQNLTSIESSLPAFSTLVDDRGFKNFFAYTLNNRPQLIGTTSTSAKASFSYKNLLPNSEFDNFTSYLGKFFNNKFLNNLRYTPLDDIHTNAPKFKPFWSDNVFNNSRTNKSVD